VYFDESGWFRTLSVLSRLLWRLYCSILCCEITRAQLNGMYRLVYDCLSICVGEATTIYIVCTFGYPRNILSVCSLFMIRSFVIWDPCLLISASLWLSFILAWPSMLHAACSPLHWIQHNFVALHSLVACPSSAQHPQNAPLWRGTGKNVCKVRSPRSRTRRSPWYPEDLNVLL
jgi:hypothetical protein